MNITRANNVCSNSLQRGNCSPNKLCSTNTQRNQQTNVKAIKELAAMRNDLNFGPFPESSRVFMPKNDVTRDSGRKMNARKVTRPTEVACLIDRLDSSIERSPTCSCTVSFKTVSSIIASFNTFLSSSANTVNFSTRKSSGISSWTSPFVEQEVRVRSLQFLMRV